MQPGVAWSGDINGHGAPTHVSLLAGRPAEPVRTSARPPLPIRPIVAPPVPVPEIVSGTEPVAEEPVPIAVDRPSVVLAGRRPAPSVVDPDALFSQMTRDEPRLEVSGTEPSADEDVAPPLAEIIAKQAAQLAAMESAAPPVPLSLPDPVADPASEDDAMRAIEGGWSRRRVRAMTDRPEMIDVSTAVAAAQSAVQKVLAQTEIETTPHEHPDHAAGKPAGLPRPREGRRDNLREIMGLSPLDESTLNNLGIYHLEQVAAWTAPEVLWLEDHVFAHGRIGRETWQSQALDLLRRRPPPSRVRG
jgi:predicted flap endonuclease-1-like 5' DNA nuclease